jgi:lysophospholipase L1-like esterase
MNLGKILKNALVFFVSLALAFTLGEILVRSLNLVPPLGKLSIGHYQLSDDPLIRYAYKKNAVPKTEIRLGNHKVFMRQVQSQPFATVNQEDFDAFVRASKWDTFYTNSWGFCDDEFVVVKPANTVRIAALGDSITTALNVSRGERFTERIETCLNHKGHTKQFEVMNFGVGGYNTLQEVATLQTKVLPFQPDIVLIAYCLNDNLPNADGGLYQLLMDQVSTKPDKWISAFQRNTQSRFCKLIRKSQLCTLMKSVWDTKFSKEKIAKKKPGTEPDIVTQAFSRLSSIRQKYGCPVVVVVFPYFKNMSDYAYRHLHVEVAAKAERYGFQVLDLFGYYLKEIERDGTEFRATGSDFCHPNAFGHKIAAQAICETLEQKYPRIIH